MKQSIVIGVFKGMGDLLCAAPVILAELQQNKDVHVLLFPNATLHEFCSCIDVDPHRSQLHLHSIPDSTSYAQWKKFLGEMRALSPDMIWISPHAPKKDSSWKIPLVLRTIQLLFWKHAVLVGADSERLARLFHQKLPVNRRLSLRQREWSAYRLLRGPSLPEWPQEVQFVPGISARRAASPVYDLVIHPGANAKNRTWPFEKYAALIAALPPSWRIAFLGLPADIAVIKSTISPSRQVEYVTGTIAKSIETLASAAMLLVMDSGNMHFAQALGVPSVAVFGYTDPADIIDLNGCVATVYEQRFPCQPCKKAQCSQPEIYCLTNVASQTVAKKLLQLWNVTHREENLASGFIQISDSS